MNCFSSLRFNIYFDAVVIYFDVSATRHRVTEHFSITHVLAYQNRLCFVLGAEVD